MASAGWGLRFGLFRRLDNAVAVGTYTALQRTGRGSLLLHGSGSLCRRPGNWRRRRDFSRLYGLYHWRRLHDGRRLRCLGSFRAPGRFFFAQLLLFGPAQLGLFAQTRFVDFALAPFVELALACLDQSARTSVHFARRKLAQHLLIPLVAARLLVSRFLENTRLRFCWRRLRLLRCLFGHSWDGQALSLRLYKNGFRAAMAEVLTDMPLVYRALYIQRHGLPPDRRLAVRFFRFAHSIPWRRGATSASPVQ